MFPYIGEVQILGIKTREFPARDGKPAQVVNEVDFYVPNEGAGKARLFDSAQYEQFNSLIGKKVRVKVNQSIYKGFPQFRLEVVGA